MSSLPSVTVNGPVLRWARTSINIPLEKAAERLDCSPDELSDWEASGHLFRFTELEHIATVYRRPTAALLNSSPPPESPLPSDHRTLGAQGQHPLSTPTILAIRFAQRVQESASDAASLLHEGLTTQLPAASLTGDPEALASVARAALGIPLEAQSMWRGPYEPLSRWTTAVESLGVYVLRQKMPIAETRGFALAGMPPVITLNSEDAANGRTFSLMHELCHLMLSMSSVCDMRVVGYDEASGRIEVFCNRFAGAVLVPEPALLSTVSHRSDDPRWSNEELGRLARHFAVSQEVILRRLLIAGKTDEEFYQGWRQEAEAVYSARRAQRNKGRGQPPAARAVQENGHLFVGQVLRAEGGRTISASEAAQFLSVGVKHLDKVRELSA